MAESVAVTARRLRRLEAWSDWQAAGGTRQSVVDDAIAARASITLENEQLSVTLPLASPSITALGARKIIRIDQEDSRTNILPQSQAFDSATWAKTLGATGSAPVVTANIGVAPDGTLTADKVVFAAPVSGDTSIISQNGTVSVVAGSTYTATIYAKAFAAGDVGKILVLRHVGRTAYATIILTADWQRIPPRREIAFNSSIFFGIGLTAGANGSSSGTVSAFLWGAQLEPGTSATDMIPTTTAAVTVDAIFDEYRILERAVDDQQGVWAITAAPLRLTDLGGSALISRKDSDGVVVYDFEVLGLTPTEVITNWVLPALASAGFGWITIGTITPTARLDMTFAWDTPLSVLLRLATATTCELDLRKSGAGYVIDLVSKLNSDAQRADLRIDKNLINVTRSESAIDQATRIFPKGASDGEIAGTMARARWQVSAVTTRGTNALIFANDIANAAWTKSGGLGAVLNAVGIDGVANRATTLTDNDAANFLNAARGVTIANDNATHTLSVYIGKDNDQTRFPQVTFILQGGTIVQRAVAIDTKTGTPNLHNTAGTGTFRVVDGATIHPLLARWWILEITCTNNTTGNNSATASIYPAAGITLGADNVAGVGSCIIGLAQIDLNVAVFGPPIITGAATITSTDIALIDPAGGAGAIGFDNQLLFAYLRRVDGTLVQVAASVASTDIVTVMGNTGIAVGDQIEFRADSAGADLTYLEDPAAVATYGIKAAVRDVSDVPSTNNLVKNPAMRAWPGSSSAPPTNWTAVGAPTIAKQTAAPFTAIGGNSIKVTGTADAQGVISDAVTIFPTATNPYLSGYAKVWVASGNARVELVITTPTGAKIFPALPDVATPTSLGQWFDVGAAGFDANAVAATAAQIRIVQNGLAASVFYIDAAQITMTSTQQPWFEGSGATRLWQEANDALRTGSNPVVSFTVPLVDLEAYDPVTWSESALIIGANARIVDPRLGIDIITRIVGLERDYLQPENISITLSNRFDDLTDLLASSTRPNRDPGSSEAPATIPQQPKLTASFDINGQLIINSTGDNDVVSQKIAWATGSAPSAATVRAATATNQQNISGLATGSTYAQGTTVFIAAFAYDSAGLESSPLTVISVSRQGAIIDYTPFASTLAPIAILSSLPGTGAFVGQIVFLTTDKKLYRWDGTSWSTAVAAVDITGQIGTAQIAASAVTATELGAAAVIAGKIAANAVGSTEIASLSITNAKIAANAVDTGKLAANAVTTTELNALAVTAAKIANATITTTQIAAAAAITGAQIAALTIGAANIIANTITAAKIAALTITATEIAANTITAAKIAALTITAAEIAASTITGAKIAALTITAGNIAANTITAAQIQALSITAAEIATGTITTNKIAAGAITAGKISIGSGGAALNSDPMTTDITAWDSLGGVAASIVTLTDGKVGPTAIRSSGYSGYESHRVAYDPTKSYRVRAWARKSAGATGTLYIGVGVFNHAGAFADASGNYFYIAASAVTASTTWTEYTGVLAANRSWATTPETIAIILLLDFNISEAQYMEAQDVRLEEVLPGTLIMDGAIITNKLAANAVTAGKIAADTITASEIAAGAITSSELATGSVIAGKIAALTIVAGDIAAATITGAKIAANTISASNIVANTITAGQIQAGAISSTELAAGAVTAGKISAGAVTAGTIAAGAITATEISAGTITADRIVANSIGPAQTVGRGSILGYKTNTQTLTTGTTPVQLTLDNAEFNLGAGVTRSGNQFIINDAIATYGSWAIVAQVGFAGNSTGDRHIEIRKNGTAIAQGTHRACANAATPTIFTVATTVSGLSNTTPDAFDVYIWEDSGSNVAVSLSRAQTFFAMYHLW